MSVGLFGAYTGSPRLQRAYASGCAPANAYVAAADDSLFNALNTGAVTCIEIEGTILLNRALPVIDTGRWVNTARESEGLTIFGDPTDGADGLDGRGTWPGIRMYLDPTQQPGAASQNIVLNISDVTFTDLQDSFSGGAIFAAAANQTADLNVNLTGVTFTGNQAGQGQGGAVYLGALDGNQGDLNVALTNAIFTGNAALQGQGGAVYVVTRNPNKSVDLNVTQSEFHNNTSSNGYTNRYTDGGAIYAYSAYDTAVVHVTSSTFTNNSTTSTSSDPNRKSRGGAIAVTSYLGGTAVIVDGQSVFTGNEAVAATDGSSFGGAIYSDAGVAISGNGDVQFTDNASGGNGGAIFAVGPVTIGPGANFDRNTATGNPAKGGAIFTSDYLTVTGNQARPVAFTDDSATSNGGAVFAGTGGSITSAIFEGNTADWGGAAFSGANGWTFNYSTITNNYAATAAGGVFSGSGSTAFYRSAIVHNRAGAGSPGGIFVDNGGSLVVENSFVGSNSANDTGAGIYTYGDVDLRFSTIYDNVTSRVGGVSEIRAHNINSTMSVVGNSTSGNVMSITGSLDDSYSVSTSTDPAADFDDATSRNLLPGLLGLGNLPPGELGLTPSPESPLALTAPSGLAPLVNPLPGFTTDQRGFARVAPFTIGARQALTINSVTPNSGDSTGGQLVTIHGSAFTGTTSAAIGGSALTNLTIVDDTTITGMAPAGIVGDADVTVTDASGTATLANGFEFVAPTPNPPNPNPPAPAPATPASAPRDVRAVAKVESAEVSWLPPESTGTFPVTSYQAVASPGGEACLVTAPALTCTITGLNPGTTYTVTARALTGAGWGATSSPSETIVPLSPPTPTPTATILITNSRDRAQKSMARIEGTTTGLVGAEVVPYLRMAGQTDFRPGASTRTVDAQGNFVWQRKAKKRFTVYFVSGDVTSNRLVIRPE